MLLCEHALCERQNGGERRREKDGEKNKQRNNLARYFNNCITEYLAGRRDSNIARKLQIIKKNESYLSNNHGKFLEFNTLKKVV